MTYTLRNSIKLLVQEGEYKILDSTGQVVYSGRADKNPSLTSTSNWVVIDFAPIFRQLVKPVNYTTVIDNNTFAIPDTTGSFLIRQYFTIVQGEDTINQLYIYWDYKYEWNYNDLDYCEIHSYGIQDYVYTRQLVPLYIRNNSETITKLYFNEEEWLDDMVLGGNTIETLNIDVYGGLSAGARVVNTIGTLEEGATVYVRWTTDNETVNDMIPKYKLRQCHDKDVVTLYWLNLNGGLSWCHFDAKFVESNNITRNQITHQANFDYDDRGQFGIDNYNIKSYKSWVLNTNWLNDRQSELIQDLFKSPKVWMQKYDHDNLENGLITSVVLTDTKSTLKTFKNDKMFNYTVNIRESKTENIYA